MERGWEPRKQGGMCHVRSEAKAENEGENEVGQGGIWGEKRTRG